MYNVSIFNNLIQGQFCTYKKELGNCFGFEVGKKYPIVEIQKNCNMVSFEDPLDGGIADFYDKNFLEYWDVE